ncbi:MAG: hypothetical protein VXW87_03585 [Pseudomonadota bacterium]|nr:hypothetical protein [Pseudomonadota bacterium]
MVALRKKAYSTLKTFLKETQFASNIRFSQAVISPFAGFPWMEPVNVSYKPEHGIASGLKSISNPIAKQLNISNGRATGIVVGSAFDLIDALEDSYTLYSTNMPSLAPHKGAVVTKVQALDKLEATFGDSKFFADFVSMAHDMDFKEGDEDIEASLSYRFSKYRKSKLFFVWLEKIANIFWRFFAVLAAVFLSRILVVTSFLLLRVAYVIMAVKRLAQTTMKTKSRQAQLEDMQRQLRASRQKLVFLSKEVALIVRYERFLRQVRWLLDNGQEAFSPAATQDQKRELLELVAQTPKHLVPKWLFEAGKLYQSDNNNDKEKAIQSLNSITSLDEYAAGLMKTVEKKFTKWSILKRAVVAFLKDEFLSMFTPGKVIIGTLFYIVLTAIGVSGPWLPVLLVLSLIIAKPLVEKVNEFFKMLFFSFYMSKFMRPIRRALPFLDKVLGVNVVNEFDCELENYQQEENILFACELSEGKGFNPNLKLAPEKYYGPAKDAPIIAPAAAAA